MGNLAEQIDEACRTHDIRDVLGLAARKRTIVCPLPTHVHHNNTPSFSIFWRGSKQWWKCHGACNLEGDIVDLVGFLRVSGYRKTDPKSVRAALNLLDSRYEVKIVLPPPPEKPGLKGSEWLDFLPAGPEVIEYARLRGLTSETLTRFRVGQSKNFMAIPAFEEQRLMGIKFRNVRSNPDFRYWSMEGSKQTLFNFDAVYLTTKPVLIVKAEIPAMLLIQMGYLACAPTGGEGGWREHWRTVLALAPKVLVGDNDEAGRKLGEKRAAFFSANLVFPAPGNKDIDEMILKDPLGSRAIIDRWINEAQE